MSRKTAERFQDPLEDQGWQQMRILLDQEMPEKKRRFIWWPWLGATGTAVMLLLLGYPLFFNQAGSSVKNDMEISQMKSENDPSITEAQEKMDKIAPDSEINEATRKGDRDEVLSNTKQRTTEYKAAAFAHSSGNAEHIKESSSVLSLLNKREPELTNGLGESHPENENTQPVLDSFSQPTISDINDLAAIKNTGEQNIASRPKISLAEITVPQVLMEHFYAIDGKGSASNDDDANFISATRRSQLDVSVSAATTLDMNFNKAGFDVGSLVRFKPWPKVSVAAGFFLWSIHSDQTFISFVKTDPNSPTFTRFDQDGALVAIPEMQNADNVGQGQPGSTSYVQTIKNLSYLRIPIFIQFFPEHTWQPYLGINQILLLSDGRNGLIESTVTVDLASNGANIKPYTDLVRLSNTGVVLGLTFQSSKHLNFDLSYTHGSKSYLNYQVSQGTFDEFHRFIRLGIGYRF